MDTFSARRTAKLREYVRKFLHYAHAAKIAPTAYNFEEWVNTTVKNKNFKLQVNIDKYYGTSLWLCYASQRANYWKLHKAAVRVFSGLFHSNGNCNYSVIETYDEYVMRCMHRNNPQLYEHLVTRFFTNLTGKPYPLFFYKKPIALAEPHSFLKFQFLNLIFS